MENGSFFAAVKRRWGFILLLILFFLAIAAIISFGQTLKYRSSSRLLIIQDNTSLDPYSLSTSNQYLGSLLSEAAYSGSFFELLSASDSQVDWTYFGSAYKDQIQKWKETVAIQNVGNTGIIQIDIYHPNPSQARAISLAVNNLLIAKNGLYQNGGKNLKLEIIDQPVLSSWPVRPNLPLNFSAALILGLLFGLSYVYYFPTKRVKPATDKRTVEPAVNQPTIPSTQFKSFSQPENDQASHPFSGNMRNIVG